jgi:AmmeMemoRadiSam system protein A
MSSLPSKEFSIEDRRAMLTLARSAILIRLEKKSPYPMPIDCTTGGPPCFSLRRGVFVTLEVHRSLRGCIGVVEARDPLCESIVHCAQGAAFRDPRFSPLRAEEVPGLQIEISVLSNVFPIAPGEIEIGKHGLVISTESNRGLLLPQVATENRLSRESFLAETCHKAGLPRDAWRDPATRIEGFTCEVFHED